MGLIVSSEQLYLSSGIYVSTHPWQPWPYHFAFRQALSCPLRLASFHLWRMSPSFLATEAAAPFLPGLFLGCSLHGFLAGTDKFLATGFFSFAFTFLVAFLASLGLSQLVAGEISPPNDVCCQ